MSVTELSKEKYNTVRGLFNADYPNLPFVFAVIEQRMPGRIWVDNESFPKVCLITSGGPYCFIAGKLSKEIFVQFLFFLKEKSSVKLIFPVSTYESQFQIADFGFESIPRLEYQYKNTTSITRYEYDSEYELMPVKDDKTLTSCNWFSLINSFYSNPEIYLKNGISLILYDTKKNCIASEAHGVIADSMVEVGTITHEDYRDKKLSTIVCNKLIHDCIKKGLHPIWTCDKTNIASRKVAEHQGMDVKMEYTFHTLKK